MNLISEQTVLTERISGVEARGEELQREIAEIGMPAGRELKRRLERLRIEERALRRNVGESMRRGEPDEVRRERIDALLRHIECEEASVGHEADFLHQAAPSSVSLVAGVAARGVEFCRRGIRKLLGGRHPLGESVFVNRPSGQLEEFGSRGPR